MVNSGRDKRSEHYNSQGETEIIKKAQIYNLCSIIWFMVSYPFGFSYKCHQDKWHTSKQATYHVVDKNAVFRATSSYSKLQMTLREEPGTQFTLKNVSEEVYNSKRVGEHITLELTDAEKFPDSHEQEGSHNFFSIIDILVLFGAIVLAIAFIGIALSTDDISGMNLLMVKGHFSIKVFTILTVILGILVLRSKYVYL